MTIVAAACALRFRARFGHTLDTLQGKCSRAKTPGAGRFFACPDAGRLNSTCGMTVLSSLSSLSHAELRQLVVQLLGEVAELKRVDH